ncbi:hypothetical protein MIMGU_mgv1a013845mg [Erythranthe guttata]|uniref:Uncharacterized protein n=1 Tax=Erythranthe guttata TaxID=4155 RepID=A0A022PQN0_ERYGU|nr:hypothetical protein MIMGU_mgv1a013845mg [Erythranthe guttata]
MDDLLALQDRVLVILRNIIPSLNICSRLHDRVHLHRKRDNLKQSLICGPQALISGVDHMGYIGGMAFVLVLSIPYFMGLLYITMIWHLASVVSVLEESYGLNAMRKSRGLIKGKMGISAAVFVVLGLSFFGIQHMFKIHVVFGHEGIVKRIVYGIICLVLLSISMLFQLIMETIVYFVCKSYHHENIDKSSSGSIVRLLNGSNLIGFVR